MKEKDMSEFKFNSQICTSREQGERLLALGLKKETADMCWIPLNDGRCVLGVSTEIRLDTIPAWSLHRMMSMLTAKRKVMLIRFEADLYDVLIDKIEQAIKEGYFNKEYLEE